jgi:uncharacterized membrane protein
MNKLKKIFLIINGVILLTYGLVFLVKPTTLGKIVGFTYNNPNALVEIMAFYGGLEIGLGLFFIWSALDKKRFKTALTAFTFIFLATGVARLLGIFEFGHEDPSQIIVTVI